MNEKFLAELIEVAKKCPYGQGVGAAIIDAYSRMRVEEMRQEFEGKKNG